MEYGKLRGIDKPVSRLIQGAIMLHDERLDEAFTLLDGVFAAGCTAIDSARVYQKGHSEAAVGAWVRERGLRDQIVLITKGAHPSPENRHRVTPQDIAADVQTSLVSYGLDMIDVYLLHRDDPPVPVGPIIECLNEQQAAGRIGIFGGSNWSVARLEAANEYAYAHNLQPFAVSSPHFSLATQYEEPWPGCRSIAGESNRADYEWYAQQQTPLLTWSSLAGGFMTGRFRRDNLDSFSTDMDLTTVRAYCGEENFERLERAEQLAGEKGITLPQVALAYVLSQPKLDNYALVGCMTPEEYRMNADAVAIRLSADEIAWLEMGE